MVTDIVPELLENIKKDFNKNVSKNKKLKRLLNLIESGNAKYSDANEYAIELGEVLSNSFNKYIKADTLPDGKMYYNIANRILNDTLKNNHDLIADVTVRVQSALNVQSGFRLKGVKPELNQNRLDSIVNRISVDEPFDEAKWILNEPIVNFSQSVVDDSIKLNAEFHSDTGLYPTITRTVDGADACNWCKSVAGVFKYPGVPQDIYKRHDRCRCTVEYDPGDSKRKNIWS